MAAVPIRVAPDRLEWRVAHESGNHRIDSQHNDLFALVNAMSAEAAGGVSARVIMLLDEIITHILVHFRDEEAELRKLEYPGLDAHRREHSLLIQQALLHRQRLAECSGSWVELMDFLADEVVTRHMLGFDRDYFELIPPAAN
jgi:hemerythrin-like metal-binding protein